MLLYFQQITDEVHNEIKIQGLSKILLSSIKSIGI